MKKKNHNSQETSSPPRKTNSEPKKRKDNQVEEELRAREDRYRSFIELTGQLGWTTNADGEVEEDIPTWRKYTGQSKEEVKGWGWAKALHPDDVKHTIQIWKHAVKTISNYEVEYRVRGYDGTYRHFMARGVPVLSKDGNIREWVGICIDITERKQAEREIASLSKIISENPHPVLRIDNKGNILYKNEAFRKLLRNENLDEEEALKVLPANVKALINKTLKSRKALNNIEMKVRERIYAYSITPVAEQRCAHLYATDITDRMGAEKELTESEKRYHTLFDEAADSIYLIDPGTQKIIDCNLKASEVTGYTMRQLKDKKVKELFPQEEQIVVSSILKKITESGELSGISGIHLLKRSGELVPIEINAKSIELGEKDYSLGIFRDITARNKVEEELKKSRERYQSLFQHMFIGCALHKIIVDQKSRPIDYEFLQVNDAFVKLTGLKRSDVIGKKVTKVIPGIEKTEFDWIGKYGKIALEGGYIQFEQFSKPLKKWFSVSAYRPMENHFIAMFEDITERKRAEEDIMRSKEEWEKTFDTIPDMVMISDAEFRIRNVNKAFAERLGIKRKDLIGKECYTVLHGTKEPPPFCPHTKTARTGIEHIEEIYEDRLKGHFILSCTPLYDREGRPDGVVEVARDISDRVRVENALRISELKYRTLVDNALVGVFKSNLKGDILFANEALARMFHYDSPEELMSAGALVHYKNPEERAIFLRQLKKKRKVTNYELDVLTKSGTTKHILFNATLDGDTISGMIVDNTARKELDKKLQKAAITDDLTGIFNRRGFITLGRQQCKLADRNKNNIVLLYLDLDNLKIINDQFGHEAGDQALIDVSSILKNSFRKSDIIGRLGGDEFAVLLTDSSRSENKEVILKNVKSKIITHNKKTGRLFDLSLSMGIVHYDPDNPCSIMELMAKADALMYKDKQGSVERPITSSLAEGQREKRRYIRFSTGKNCRGESEDISGRIRIKNLSLGGLCLQTKEELTEGKHYRIKTTVHKHASLTANSRVVWSAREQGNDGKEIKPARWETGLQFVSLSEQEMQSLDSIISELVL